MCWISLDSNFFVLWENINLIVHLVFALEKPLEIAFIRLIWIDFGIQRKLTILNWFFIVDMFFNCVT